MGPAEDAGVSDPAAVLELGDCAREGRVLISISSQCNLGVLCVSVVN